MKKIICLVLTLFMAVGIFSGCGNRRITGNSIPVGINDEGVFVYSITRAADTTADVETTAKNLRSTLKKSFNCNILMLKDSVEDYDGNYEILVGETNRRESLDAIEKLKNNRPNNNMDFIVTVKGDKIVIGATTSSMVEVACKWFAQTFDSIEKMAMLYDGYEFMYIHENPEGQKEVLNTASGINLGFFTVVVPTQWPFLCGREVDKFIDVMDTLGYPVKTKLDTDDPAVNEIIFGDCDREESKAVTVSGDDYIIKVVGTKVIIKGGSDLATYQAIADFNEMISNTEAAGESLELQDGTAINGKYSADKEGTYTLNFNDDFNGSQLNYKIWSNYGTNTYENYSGGTSCLGGQFYYANIYNKEFIYVSDGALYLHAKKINDKDFRSSQVSTCYSMLYRYGFWEVRQKFAEAPATIGLWTNAAYLSTVKPAIGDMDRESFTEIDLVENFGSVSSFASNVHRWANGMDAAGNGSSMMHTSWDGDAAYNANGNNKRFTYSSDDGKNLSDDFHIYSYYADDEHIEFAFDGHAFCKCDFKNEKNGISIFCMQNYIIQTCEMGASSYGAKWTSGMTEDAYSVCDYSRIYQTDSVGSQMRYGCGYNADGKYPGGSDLSYVYPENPRSY